MRENQIGALLKTVRLYKGYQKKEVSDYCSVSSTYLTKIENDSGYNSGISKDTLSSWSKFLNIEIQSSVLDKDYLQVIDRIMEKFIEGQFDEIKALYNSLPKESEMLNSYVFPLYLLAGFSYEILVNDDYDASSYKFDILERVHHHFSNQYLQYYFLLRALYYKNFFKDRSDDVQECLTRAQVVCQTDSVLALIKYQQGVVNIKMGNYIAALESTRKAKDLFQSTHNFARTAAALMHMGVIYLHLKDYNYAIKMYNESIMIAAKMNCNNVVALNYHNIAWANILNKKYELVYENVKKAVDLQLKNPAPYVNCAYAFYKLGDKVNSNLWVEKGLKECKTKNVYYQFLKAIKDFNNKPDKKVEVLEKLIVRLETKEEYYFEILVLLYNEVVEAKLDMDKHHEAVAYLKRLVEL